MSEAFATNAVERKPRALETIIERNERIARRLLTTSELLHSMVGRLVGGDEGLEVSEEVLTHNNHISILNQQQGIMEALCLDILNSINVLEDNI